MKDKLFVELTEDEIMLIDWALMFMKNNHPMKDEDIGIHGLTMKEECENLMSSLPNVL